MWLLSIATHNMTYHSVSDSIMSIASYCTNDLCDNLYQTNDLYDDLYQIRSML